jgi:hypothetical protein
MTGKTRTVPVPVSERMRLYRQRRQQGVRLVRIPLQVTNIDDLVQLGRLRKDERHNEEALRAAVLGLLHQALEEARVPFWARDQ